MDERERKMMEMLGLTEADFLGKKNEITPEERMYIIEEAILELGTLIAEVERNG